MEVVPQGLSHLISREKSGRFRSVCPQLPPNRKAFFSTEGQRSKQAEISQSILSTIPKVNVSQFVVHYTMATVLETVSNINGIDVIIALILFVVIISAAAVLVYYILTFLSEDESPGTYLYRSPSHPGIFQDC